ncbi:Disease resistance protein SUMM2 [Citrus sinensis]|nr:Disease resistance protein SUMM2 [Citrus sinensis]
MLFFQQYTRFKFSYDNLPSDIIRSCLLYCCLFPKDYGILRRDLIDYWVSEGFLDNFEDGYTIIGDLFRACLLEAEDIDSIKLHDVIRDMSLWITCKIEEENFLVRTGVGLTEIPKIEEWKGAKRISLMKTKIERQSGIPICPRLHTLLLTASEIEIITDSFFQFMPSLRVLSLNRNRSLTKLPSGISCLVSLQQLDLSVGKICSLKAYLKALVNLRYLNLENTHRMARIPQQMISSFSKLQVLKKMECGLSADALSLIKELLCLEHLNHITLTFESSRAVEFLLKFPKLLSVTQSLSIRSCKSPAVNVLHLAHMEHLQELKIDSSNLEELKIDYAEEVPKVLQSGFCSVHAVGISFCTVKDLTWLVFAPNLKKIKIVIMECHAMEEIISAEKLSGEVSEIMGRPNLFAQLESLTLLGAGNLKSIYRYPLPFPHLKTIRVHGCPKLKKLSLSSISIKERKIVIDGEKEWWEELQWEDEAT